MLSIVKTVMQFAVYSLINFFVNPPKEILPKSLLLVRLDGIGDYVLFRNFIEKLKTNKIYKSFNITLLGNSVWKDLSEEADSQFVDKFIWLDMKRFRKDLFYRYRMLSKIASFGYQSLINPTYSRDFFGMDTIVKCVHAEEKIGSTGNLSNMQEWQKNISDKYYTKLVPARSEVIFEFYRNKEFFENLLDQKLDINQPTIELKNRKLRFELPQNYALLFIGASVNFRKWSMKGFSEVARYLKSTLGYEIVLCGGSTDIDQGQEFKKYYGDEFLNLVGEISLTELLTVIANGNLMIANETSAPHLAVALEMANIFVIYNGNHFGRFTPYPKEMAPDYHVVFHPEIERDFDSFKKLSNTYGFVSDLDITEISSVQVIEKIGTFSAR